MNRRSSDNTPNSGSYTLIGDTGGDACGLADGVDDNQIGVAPNLGPLADNGCVTPAGAPGSAACVQTHALLDPSPAIDTADAAVCQAAPVDGLDQRGAPRGIDCDIGAYEYGAVVPSDQPRCAIVSAHFISPDFVRLDRANSLGLLHRLQRSPKGSEFGAGLGLSLRPQPAKTRHH